MSAQTILTMANGKGIDLMDPLPSDIDFGALSEHLAKEKRFNGATRGVEYSVAEHLCRGSDAILSATKDETLAAYFLCHDMHEATLKDDTTPKKRALAEIAERHFGILSGEILQAFGLLTHRHDCAIHAAAGLQFPPDADTVIQIRHWDLVMFVTEWRDLMGHAVHPNWGAYAHIVPLEARICNWQWGVAKRALLRRCHRLLPALKGQRP